MTGANLLSALRAVVAIPVTLLLLANRPGMTVAAGILFWVGGMSDLLDGHLARRADRTSDLGAWLDPFADKVLVDGTALALARRGWLPAGIAYGLIVRDLVVTGLRMPRQQQRALMPGWLPKLKTALLYAGMCGLIIAGQSTVSGTHCLRSADSHERRTGSGTRESLQPNRWLALVQRASQWSVIVGVTLSVISALEYAFRLLRQGSQSRPAPR